MPVTHGVTSSSLVRTANEALEIQFSKAFLVLGGTGSAVVRNLMRTVRAEDSTSRNPWMKVLWDSNDCQIIDRTIIIYSPFVIVQIAFNAWARMLFM